MDAYEKLKAVRSRDRMTGKSFIDGIVTEFLQMHGDRCYGDDKAVIGGVGRIKGIPVTVIAQEKGTDIESRMKHNFGSPHPEGYRKSLRLMKQAEKFNRPVICFVDTMGAYCGVGAEERGQGFAIGDNIAAMLNLRVPVISIIVGEGGSGGAIALACANRVYMLENAVYSIVSPEGFASILWKDKSRAKEACALMKITGDDLYKLKVIDGIIEESQDKRELLRNVEEIIYKDICKLKAMNKDDIAPMRYDRFRKIGAALNQI